MTDSALLSFSQVLTIVAALVAAAAAFGTYYWGGRETRRYLERLSDAEVQTAQSSERIAQLNKAAEGLRLEVAVVDLERVRLEAQVAPRRLTREAQRLISTRLLPFRGTTVRVISLAGDIEGAILATQVLEALRAAGLEVDARVASFLSLGLVPYGVSVKGMNSSLVLQLMGALVEDGKLMVVTEPPSTASAGSISVGDSDAPEPAAVIMVGAKPLDFGVASTPPADSSAGN